MKRISKRILSNLMKVWDKATPEDKSEGMNWYPKAHDFAVSLSIRYNVSIPSACGVLAALSPGLEWNRNMIDATELLKAYSSGQPIPMVGAYGKANTVKAEKCASGIDPLSILGGQKVRNFYSCILDPTSKGCCIDRHAKSAAEGITLLDSDKIRQTIIRDTQYQWYAEHYRTCAHNLGVSPSQFQAVIWVVWKRLKRESTWTRGNTLRLAA
ncbi:MAG TPA: hypothetical protein VNZ86_15150, partial [Bacteroidia bacterium]|nr:hypothetical protein [Bacteroidia bacterium]